MPKPHRWETTGNTALSLSIVADAIKPPDRWSTTRSIGQLAREPMVTPTLRKSGRLRYGGGSPDPLKVPEAVERIESLVAFGC